MRISPTFLKYRGAGLGSQNPSKHGEGQKRCPCVSRRDHSGLFFVISLPATRTRQLSKHQSGTSFIPETRSDHPVVGSRPSRCGMRTTPGHTLNTVEPRLRTPTSTKQPPGSGRKHNLQARCPRKQRFSCTVVRMLRIISPA